MPWRLDSHTRTDEIVAAVQQLIATGGVAAVTYRAVAASIRLSHSSLHDHYPDRAHMLKVSAFGTARLRAQEFSQRVRSEGLAAMIPETEHELRQSVIWLALRDHARIEPMLSHVVTEAYERELVIISDALEAASAAPSPAGTPATPWSPAAQLTHGLIEGLESARTVGVDPLTHARAVELLEHFLQTLRESSSTKAA